MNKALYILTGILISTAVIFAQVDENKKDIKAPIKNKINGIDAPQAVEGDVIFSDGTNQLLRITDEGTTGAIQFPSGVPSIVTNKLYNSSGTLYFGNTALGSGGISTIDSLNHLADAKFDGSSLFLGVDAGLNDDGLNSNTGVGKYSLLSNTSGALNTGLGFSALNQNTTGLGNVAIGYKAAFANTSGINITAVGHSALVSNTTGIYNTALGTYSLSYNTTGHSNVGIGFHANFFNQTGSRNTVIGHRAGGGYNNSRSGNVFIGYQAGFYEADSNKLYIENTNSTLPLIWGDFSEDSLNFNANLHLTGNLTIDGTIFGTTLVNSLNDLSDAKHDGSSLFVGNSAGQSDGVNNSNTGIGNSALTTNTTGNKNSAIGDESLLNNTTGSRNTSVGAASMLNNTSGNANVALGYQSNYFNETGTQNTLIGSRAGYGSASNSFSGNVFIGYQAGYNEVLSDKLYIENSDSDTPLIWGDFVVDQVIVNGSFKATTKIVTPILKVTTGPVDGHVLTSDADGNATWQDNANPKIGFSAYFTSSKTYKFQDIGTDQVELFTETLDDGNTFNPTTGIFTAPSDGLYHFDLNFNWGESSLSPSYTTYIYIEKNGSSFPGSNVRTRHEFEESVYSNQLYSFNLYLSSNDEITIFVDAKDDSAIGAPPGLGSGGILEGGNNGNSSTFSGYKVY